MTIRSKVRRAFQILRNDGLVALFVATRNFLRRAWAPAPPDECALVFEALDAQLQVGVMVDVGAHIGTSLLPFSRAGWRILAIEPDRVNREALMAATTGMSSVSIDPRAASDHHAEGVNFYRSTLSSGISGLSAFHESHREGDRVNLDTLSRILDEYAIHRVDFLKIDTEGFDLFVLKGIPWDRLSPRVIVCEFENSKSAPLGYDFHDLASYLAQRDYIVIVSEWYPIIRYGGEHTWRRFATYPCELQDARAWGNLFAVREASLADSLRVLCDRHSARRK